MGYKVNFDGLDMMYYEIQGQMIKWNEGITNVSEKMAELITSDEIAGEGAMSIKSYLQTVHLAIMQSLLDICNSHSENCLMYKNDYQINIDQSYHAMIQEDELLEIRKRLHENQERTGTVDYHIKTALTSVSDIFYTAYTGPQAIDSTYERMKTNITRLDEEIICLENRHMNDDFTETEALIEELKTFINEQLSREKNYISNYTPAVLANSAQYAKLYQANMALSARQACRTDELQLAYDYEKKKIEFLEEEAAKKRAEEGWKTGLLALGSIIIGVVAIVGTAGAATPVVATAWVVGGSAIAYGVSDLVEAGQDIYYGTTGDPYTAAINPIRDTIFSGNQTAYMIWGEVSTTISGLIVPVGQSYTLAKATGQSGKMLAATVGKTAAKELAEDFVIGQVSMGTGSLVQNVTGNADLGTLAGVTAGITAGKGSGKALHSVDNVASGVKSIKQIDSAASGIKSIDSVTQSGAGGVNESGSNTIKNALPNVEKSIINPNKLTGYALNPGHPVGGNKAKVFESALGYNQSNADNLMKQIYEKLPQNEAILGKLDQYGQRYTVDIPITGPNGNTANVRTGWIIKTGSDVPELTTIYVK